MNYIFKGKSHSSIFLTEKVSIKKLLIVAPTIPACGFILTCLHQPCARDSAIPRTTPGTKNHRRLHENWQSIWCRQALQRLFVQELMPTQLALPDIYLHSVKTPN